MVMNKINASRVCRLLPALMLVAACCFPAQLGAKMSYHLNDTARSGFNALDHVLQKPLGNPVFEHKRFGDHFFMSGGAGFDMAGLHARPGLRGELSFGDWATPVHGWRVTLAGGVPSISKGNPSPAYGAIGADYLLNLSSLLRGYDNHRMFELIGGLGAEYRRVRVSGGSWGNEIGVRASLQAKFNVSPGLFLYLEPRLTLYAGTRYQGVTDRTRRFRPDAGLNLGLGYRLLRGAERREGTTDFVNVDDSHLFFGAGAGAATFVRGANSSTLGPTAQIYAGKWLSSVAGLRLKADLGRYVIPSAPGHRYIATGALDYIWDISTAFSGYRPNEVFDLSLNLGVAAAYADNAKTKIYPGVEGGLTAAFRLSPNWSLYIEPQVQVFTRKFAGDVGKGNVISPMASVIGGVRYTIGNFAHDFADSYADYEAARNSFLTISGAPSWRMRSGYDTGFAASAGFGKRFTPISSWRLTADGEYFNRSPKFLSLALSADYLFSISTSMAGFNPDRVFDLSGVLGLSGGIARRGGGVKPYAAAKAGLHGAFRLNDALDLFIEPQFVATYTSGGDAAGWTPGVRVMAGLTYRLGRQASFGDNAIADSPIGDCRNFVSLTAAPTLFSGNIGDKQVNGAIDATVGRWFTLVSGARLGLNYDFVPPTGSKERLNLGTVHADYLLNVTSLITRNPDRHFHIIGLLGGGIAFSDDANSHGGLMLETGMQFRYNLPYNIDVHIEPNASFVMNRVAPSYASDSRFIMFTRVMAGASYRF